MNIQTDIDLSFELLDSFSYSYSNLLRIAREGSEEQRDILLSWAAAVLPAFLWEELVETAGRKTGRA